MANEYVLALAEWNLFFAGVICLFPLDSSSGQKVLNYLLSMNLKLLVFLGYVCMLTPIIKGERSI
jgi:hypothetical protein